MHWYESSETTIRSEYIACNSYIVNVIILMKISIHKYISVHLGIMNQLTVIIDYIFIDTRHKYILLHGLLLHKRIFEQRHSVIGDRYTH